MVKVKFLGDTVLREYKHTLVTREASRVRVGPPRKKSPSQVHTPEEPDLQIPSRHG